MHITDNALEKKPWLQHQYRHTMTKVKERSFRNVGYSNFLYTQACFRKQLSCLSWSVCMPARPSSFTISPAHPDPGNVGVTG